MLSLKPGSGLWFTAAGTGGEETAIDNTALAGGGWDELWAGTECILHVLSSLAMSQSPGGKRPGVWNVACPILLQWPGLSTPSNFVSLPSTFQREKFSAKTFTLCLVLLKGFHFWSEWLVMQRQVQEQGECPVTGMVASKGKHPSTTAVPLPFVTLKFHWEEKPISCKTRKCRIVASHKQQFCQSACCRKSTPRECLGRFNFLNPLSCCYTTRSFTSRGVRRHIPWGLCNAWQQNICHLMLLSGSPGQERCERLGVKMTHFHLSQVFLRWRLC